jgi:hypothetical protein
MRCFAYALLLALAVVGAAQAGGVRAVRVRAVNVDAGCYTQAVCAQPVFAVQQYAVQAVYAQPVFAVQQYGCAQQFNVQRVGFGRSSFRQRSFSAGFSVGGRSSLRSVERIRVR